MAATYNVYNINPLAISPQRYLLADAGFLRGPLWVQQTLVLTDMSLNLSVTDGTVTSDLEAFLKTYCRGLNNFQAVLAAYFQNRQDISAPLKTLAIGRLYLPASLRALGLGREGLEADLRTVSWTGKNLGTVLSVIRPLVFHDLAMKLSATDGTVLNDMPIHLSAIKKAPQYKSVVAQRVRSVISEVI